MAGVPESDDHQMFALLTMAGTAMHETGLCPQHYARPELRELAIANARSADDWDGNPSFTDCSGNDYLYCIAETQTIIQRLQGLAGEL